MMPIWMAPYDPLMVITDSGRGLSFFGAYTQMAWTIYNDKLGYKIYPMVWPWVWKWV